jgi:hypothetical protein
MARRASLAGTICASAKSLCNSDMVAVAAAVEPTSTANFSMKSRRFIPP